MAKTKSTSYVLTLKLKTEPWQEYILEKRFEIGRQLYNACLHELLKRYKKSQNDKNYGVLIKQEKTKERNKLLNNLHKKYGLNEYAMHSFVKPMQQHFKKNIDSFTAQKIATRAWQAIEKLIFDNAEKVRFKKYNEMDSLEGKSNSTGIRFKNSKLQWIGLNIPVIIKKNDIYAHMALQDRIKYCRIVRKLIRGKIKYYLQLILEGVPPKKINSKTGEVKHPRNKGIVGIDIGTQTIAICSEKDVKLLELAPSVDDIEREKRILQRKLDRQRRANNPHKYNENRTIKKNNLKWIWSKNYIKTKSQLAELQRKLAEKRKQDHNKLANWILSLGDDIKVETMNYKALQAKTKETIKDKNGRYKSKKRFGKSIANKAPSMFLTILDRKLSYESKKLKFVDTFSVKASQYNHFTGVYNKKKLSERWNDFGDFKIQRDLYSAFLIMNVKDNLKEIDRERCFVAWERFKQLHDKEIERLRNSGNRLLSSMGI
ncbi:MULTISPECIES: RNA-guided endonuclease TnpB family protein [unclassified Geobacillus]|uniref:RNA-guided endonuclease TnpB family protein n=1 Tax=unclassified Geobacillus TaxID=2642459 RepID=UPI000BE2C7E9|nr:MULTISPECIES: RNA-guided endonuclease TnpB family protein [unclassified Geobacillus]PDM39751.1 transposase [Parageobacillus yumthangensis]PUF88369.1 transposase [Geobacillus sp. LYN3]RDV23104.1 transposase [Parageobacillus toebii]TXK88104.1 transposase [Geobacillus sp. AYS3]